MLLCYMYLFVITSLRRRLFIIGKFICNFLVHCKSYNDRHFDLPFE